MGLIEMYDEDAKTMIEKFSILDKIYDQIRLVDPVKKRGIGYNCLDANHNSVGHCHDLWEKNQVCDNCIAMRAYSSNQTFVKLEYTSDELYMVMAVPVELGKRRAVVEILKNVTHSFVLSDGEMDKESVIYALIDNMSNLALKDELTGVYNRRYIAEKLPIDIANATLLDNNMSVIMADIDHFKVVNDTYGHLVGDGVLRAFAEALVSCGRRESDWVARYGGEEFLICLPGANLDKAAEIAEQMRKKIEEKIVVTGEHRIKITASFGVCSLKPALGIRVDTLVECADKEMYLAKQSGRNRVFSKEIVR